MKILITGGTGFIGQMLCSSFKAKNDDITVLTRSIKRAKRRLPYEGVRFIQNLNELQSDEVFDAVINLAGAPIAKRWSSSYKKELLASRVLKTEQLIQTLSKLKQKPTVLISGSAIGYYGPHGDEPLSESSQPNPSFSHQLCASWEGAAFKATELGIRVCTLRTGIVLGQRGGALQKMRLPFKLGLGGPIADGKQWMSWIHIADMIRIIHFCIENAFIEGAVNATSPQAVTNKSFAHVYANVLHRPSLIRTPAFSLKLMFGQMAEELLITGQKVIPSKLIEGGFSFVYPNLELALRAIEMPAKT